ncbi:MAG: AMP-binding protein [Gammaproteobacteria bacterium]|nr:AMP-binding protein [Gammaproteobacteria bacterium]
MQSEGLNTLPGALARAAATYGGLIGIEDGSQRLCFVELKSLVDQTAAAFVASGIRVGDRIAIWGPNAASWIIAALGAQSAGAAIVPLNTRFKGREAGYILRRSGARMLCYSGRFLGIDFAGLLKDESLPELHELIELDSSAWANFLMRATPQTEVEVTTRLAKQRPEDLADVMFTSGTTGAPKGVMASHGQNVRVFSEWSSIIGLGPQDRYLIVNPFFHAFGYKAGWLSCLLTGATILPMAVFDAAEVIRRIAADRISVLPGPPTLFQSMLAHPSLDRASTSSLRLAVTGAANVPVSLIERMRDKLGFKTIVTGYGLTESTGTVSMCRPGDDPQTIAQSCGAPLPGVEVKVVDDAGRELPRGSEGELWVRGYNVMQGYLDDAEATAAAIDSEGWLHTGDIGTMDTHDYLRITDRKKDMFITGGFNCYPAEIESLISAHPAVAQVAVVGIADERLGEVAAAYVVLRPTVKLEPSDFIAWCRDNMTNYKVPRRVHFVDQLPTTASGKVQRYALRYTHDGARKA